MEEQLTEPALHGEPAAAFVSQHFEWWKEYQYELYDWDDPLFKKRNRSKYAFRPIPLSQGYFMIVSPRDYRRMTRFPDGSPKKWRIITHRDSEGGTIKIYARRTGRADEPVTVYAHREILGCVDEGGIGDHVNGHGLDNRRPNLLHIGRGQNMHNSVRTRYVHSGLPRGVELRGKNKEGKPRYGGIRCRRSGKKVKTIRTKRTWLDPKWPALWYRNQLKRIHHRTTWANEPKSVNYPVFPPSVNSEPAPAPASRRARTKEPEHAVPF